MENESKNNIKPKSKWLFPALLMVGIIFLSLGAWAGYNQWNKFKNPQESIQQPLTEQPKDEISDWQIYRNEEYGFEFKYPSNIKFEDFRPYYTDSKKGIWDAAYLFLNNSNINISILNIKEFKEVHSDYLYNKLIELNENFDLFQEDFSGGSSCEGVEEMCQPSYFYTLKTKIDELPAIDYPHANPGGVGRAFYLLRSDKVFEIYIGKAYYNISEKEKQNDLEYKTIDQILSTFKFIEPVDTSIWKTYKNNRFGYELKYPNDWFAGIMQWSPGGGYTDIPDDFTEYITFSSKDLLLDKNQLYGGKYQSLSGYLVNEKIQTITIMRENGQAFIQNSNTVDDFWNKMGKTDTKTGRIINQFIEKRIIDNVEFIIFNQSGKSQALFMYKNNFFGIRSDGIDLDWFIHILSTFKFIEPSAISGWKTYVDIGDKFEIEYPPDWELVSQNSEKFFKDKNGLVAYIGSYLYSINIEFEKTLEKAIEVNINPRQISIEKIAMEKIKDDSEILGYFSKWIIEDNPVVRVRGDFESKNQLEDNQYKNVVYFEFSENFKDEDLIKKFLSTFKFIEPKQGFCGYSTNGQCNTDTDCVSGGCSGQVCQSKNEEPIITTCEYTDCYNPQSYGLTCGCKNNQCRWKQ